MYVVVDLGGTNTRVAVSEDGKIISSKKRFSTPQAFEKGLLMIANAVTDLIGNNKLEGLAIGIPGTIDRKKNTAFYLPHLTSWNHRDVCKELRRLLKAPVILANDAELAALGEAVLGEGKKYNIVGYLTVGTAIGGALVVNKKLIPRAYTSEPGHMMTTLKGLHDQAKPSEREWELHGSGKAFEKRFGVSPEKCNDPKLWSQHAQVLGQGVISVILVWSPEILIIGGGMSLKGDFLFKPLREYVKKHLTVFPPPPIVAAKLGDDAGLYGGLVYIKQHDKHSSST